jgi:thymidine phosphorylase
MGVPTAALISDMNQPLGRMAGNAVEVNESIDALKGRGPADLIEVTLELGAELLFLAKREKSQAAARHRLEKAISSGAGLEKFREMVAAQGGDLDAPRPVAPANDLISPWEGYVKSIDTERLGYAIIHLGGGRKQLGDKLDFSVGLEMLVRIGDAIEKGQPLVRVFARPEAAAEVKRDVLAAITIGDDRVQPPPLIVERIS